MKIALLPLLLSVCNLNAVWGFKCYSCSYSKDTDLDDTTCIKKPGDVSNPTTTCDKKYCYIRRIQFTNGGQVTSFARGCIDKLKTGKSVGADYTTYTRTCSSALCNDWDGVADKYGKGDSDMDGVIIFAPGIGKSADCRHLPAWGLLVSSMFLLCLIKKTTF